MEYYKCLDEYSGIAPATAYFEISEGWAFRDITFNGTTYLASNAGNGLPEGYIDYAPLVEVGEVTQITKQEFEQIWNAHLSLHQAEWDSAKQTYPIGEAIQGSLKIFYPQGVIVSLPNNILGVADYKACRASTTWENMYPHHKITAVVSGYDEENQWIVLDSPQVHPQKI